MAVQVALGAKPLIVKTAGASSLAGFGDASGRPPFVQLTETLTEAWLPGSKSFATVKVTEPAILRLLVIVQEGESLSVIETFRQSLTSVV